MFITPKLREQLPKVFAMLSGLPDNTMVTLDNRGEALQLIIQATTQREVAEWRRRFPGKAWNKTLRKNLGWWEYEAEHNGVEIVIYGCTEAPPTCRMEKRVELVEERVPVDFETRQVEREVIEWRCGEEVGRADA